MRAISGWVLAAVLCVLCATSRLSATSIGQEIGAGLRPCASDFSLAHVVGLANAIWLKKRPYFLSAKLAWKPKYAEEDVGITEYVTVGRGCAGDIRDEPEHSRGIGGVIKALWSDFVVEEMRLHDRSVVGLKADEHNRGTGTGIAEAASSEGLRYIKFVLCLLGGLDTITAVRKLANHLGVPYSAFRFAGIKDRYGITLQEVTADTCVVDTQRLLNSASPSSPLFQKMHISRGVLCRQHLHSGELYGNRFTICVRNVTAPATVVDEALRALEQGGFVNYFGLQRFGSGSVPSVVAGRCLLIGQRTLWFRV
jgi:tRNA(Glu) U13 pseudouridine synthase TruD